MKLDAIPTDAILDELCRRAVSPGDQPRPPALPELGDAALSDLVTEILDRQWEDPS